MSNGSVLTKNQTKKYGPRLYEYGGRKCMITARVRFDDECGNRHNTFSITGEIYSAVELENGWGQIKTDRSFQAGGCIHEDVAKAFPELAPLIKWHLCSSDGPMHYVANTMYHVLEHGTTMAWVYYEGKHDPLGIDDEKKKVVGYLMRKEIEEKKIETTPGYTVRWDEKTVKVRNLDHARSSACWPEATDEDLTAPGLKERLEARLPQLMIDFRVAVESLGFTW